MVTTTTAPSSNRRDNYFQRKLLKHAVEMLQMANVCSQFELPMNKATTTLRMFKRAKATADTVETLTEGTPSANYSSTDLIPVDVALKQYGEKCKISDVRTETDLFNQLDIEVERMGESCALKLDNLIMSNTVAKNLSKGAHVYGGGAASFTALGSAQAATSKITCADVLAAAQYLKKKRAPLYSGGYYVGILSPEQVYDIRTDPDFKDLNVHNKGGERIYKNEIGEIHGVKLLETTVPWVESSTEGTFDAEGTIFTALFMGFQAVGTVKLAGAKSMLKPTFIYNDKPDKSDPLNQFKVAGWKGYFATEVLDNDWVLSLRTKTTMPAWAPADDSDGD